MEAEKHVVRRRRAFGALAGFTLAGVVGAGLVASRPLAGHPDSSQGDGTDQAVVEAQPRQLRKVLQRWTKTECETYPWFKFDKPLYKHLANKGRPYGLGSGEGLVYRVIGMGTGSGTEMGRKVLMVLNATNFDYKPFSPRMNGMQGKFYGSVNLNSGSHLDMKMHFYDEVTKEPLTLDDIAITFFDLDMGKKGMSQESVAINGFKEYYVTPNTEVKVSNVGLGMTQFAASTFGDGADNPTNPMTLTYQQRNRAVTLLYKNVHELDVTLRASPNNVPSPRFFTFVLRPSLLCAITLEEGEKMPEASLEYTPPLEVGQPVPDQMIFDRWMVNVGDQVQKGDTLAYVQDMTGRPVPLKASNAGVVKAIQSGLVHGESCDSRLIDTTIAVIKRPTLPALPIERPDDKAAQGDHEQRFKGFKKNVGDIVDKGDVIAEVIGSNGKVLRLRSPKDGIIAAEQTKMMPGDPLERVQDENLATLGRFPPLPKTVEEHATNVPPNSEFVSYLKKKGEIVQMGNPIATIKTVGGIEQPVKASQAGVIVAEQDGLAPGMKIDDVMTDKNVATIGKLPPLEVKPGEGPASAPSGKWRFKEWMVEVGQVVKEDDPVAVVENNAGVMRTVKASKAGSVVERQEHLKPGYVIENIMKDGDIAVIGKFPSLQVSGPRGVGVTCPKEAIFKQWLVKKGDHVEVGDPIAEVIMPGSRRLADGRILQSVTTIPSPAWGTMSQEQPLKEGQTIGNQQVGPTIATIDMGAPWWVTLLVALCCLCCILCCLFGVMKKKKPAYTPMPPVEEPPPPPPKPDGLRLDFDDEGQIHTVYAKYRPLGIKHNDVAPIVAHDFTVNSYAKQELGVKDGWKLVRIDDEELNENPNFEDVNAKLHEHMRDFPLWPLPLEFKAGPHESDALREIKFLQRPIGLEFSNKAPIKVSKIYPGSPAAEEGVQEGWLITRIGEMDVTENHRFREVMHHFKEGVQPLDDSGTKYT